jgi:hypothetical protein
MESVAVRGMIARIHPPALESRRRIRRMNRPLDPETPENH